MRNRCCLSPCRALFQAPAFAYGPSVQTRARTQWPSSAACPSRARTPLIHGCASTRTRIVLLPGMDGTASLLIDNFARYICNPGAGVADASRVVLVDYPRDRYLSSRELADYVAESYLAPLADDERGYVLVAQSFSGHVALQLSSRRKSETSEPLPGLYKGTVFVNCFCSLPVRWAGPALRAVPESVFKRQPPAYFVAHFFLGQRGGSGMMEAVQKVVRPVLPSVMKSRLLLIVDEDSWHLWRDSAVLSESNALFLYGSGDLLVGGTEHIALLRNSRRDIEFVEVPGGPHLLLQTDGVECARVVDEFASSR